MLKAGGLHGLVRLLKGERPAVAPKHLPRMLSSAAAAVGRLTEPAEGLVIAESAGAAAALTAALVSGTPVVRESATATLRCADSQLESCCFDRWLNTWCI